MELVFRKPIVCDGNEKTFITLREPTIGEVIEASKVFKAELSPLAAQSAFMMELLQRVAFVPMDFIKQMRKSDVTKAQDYFNTFPLLSSSETTSSDEEEILIPLDKAIHVGKETMTEIVVVEPTISQCHEAQRVLGKDPNISDIFLYKVKLLSAITGHSVKAINQVPVMKFREAEQALENFL